MTTPLACRSAATPAPQGSAPARSTRAAAEEHQLGSPHAVWLDCSEDAHCASRAGTVCHVAVMGGTCAPPCDSDARCSNFGLACVQGRCGSATTTDGGAPR
ncbi:MAG: hypothetical protein AB2A00_33620 [Myxococcota bacterium]